MHTFAAVSSQTPPMGTTLISLPNYSSPYPDPNTAFLESVIRPPEFNALPVDPGCNFPLHAPMGKSDTDRVAQDLHNKFVLYCDSASLSAPASVDQYNHICAVVQQQAHSVKKHIPATHAQTLSQVIDKMVQNKIHSLHYYMQNCCWHCGAVGHRWAECSQPYYPSRHTTGYAPTRTG